MKTDESWYNSRRYGGLIRFGIAITIFNILGHLFFGFEQSYIQPIVALLTGYTFELILALLDSWVYKTKPKFLGGGVKNFIGFMLPAHITSLAISMLLYTNERLFPLMFAVMVGLGSKALFQITLSGRKRHFLNPSNFGLTATVVLFHWVTPSPPYHFTENFHGAYNWVLPILIICTGSFLNIKFTKRVPLLLSWVGGFIVFGMIRCLINDMPPYVILIPITGVSFILFTYYMISDPATTPHTTKQQIIFGLTTALIYNIITYNNIVYGIFFALTISCCLRALLLYIGDIMESRKVKNTENSLEAATA